MKKAVFILFLIPFVITGACKKAEDTAGEMAAIDKPAEAPKPAAGPERVDVQHILISFKGAIPDEKVTRTREEAEILAQEILGQVQAGEDFDGLVKEYTDDQYPGVYRMSNVGVEPDPNSQEYPRERMVKAFGDVGFSLDVGEVGMTTYDPATSKYGWHIIKRLK